MPNSSRQHGSSKLFGTWLMFTQVQMREIALMQWSTNPVECFTWLSRGQVQSTFIGAVIKSPEVCEERLVWVIRQLIFLSVNYLTYSEETIMKGLLCKFPYRYGLFGSLLNACHWWSETDMTMSGTDCITHYRQWPVNGGGQHCTPDWHLT